LNNCPNIKSEQFPCLPKLKLGFQLTGSWQYKKKRIGG
jgi:hypothetical protein